MSATIFPDENSLVYCIFYLGPALTLIIVLAYDLVMYSYHVWGRGILIGRAVRNHTVPWRCTCTGSHEEVGSCACSPLAVTTMARRSCFACARVGSEDMLDAYVVDKKPPDTQDYVVARGQSSPVPRITRDSPDCNLDHIHRSTSFLRGQCSPVPRITRDSPDCNLDHIHRSTSFLSTAFKTKLNDDNLLHPENAENKSNKHWRHDKKRLSGSAPLLADPSLTLTPSTSRSRHNKFHRHFQVDPEENVIDYFSCALVADILLQGHLYISKNYFAFYSNVFGYVTKLQIPTASVVSITKEKTAFILPNAVGVTTADTRHVFSSLRSRDTTYRLMVHVWCTAVQVNHTADNGSQPIQPLSNPDPEVWEPSGSVCDESSSQSDTETMVDLKTNGKPTVSTVPPITETNNKCAPAVTEARPLPQSTVLFTVCTVLLVILFLSVSVLMYRVVNLQQQLTVKSLTTPLYDIQDFLENDLDDLYKIRQVLEVLSKKLENDKQPLIKSIVKGETHEGQPTFESQQNKEIHQRLD